MKRQSNLGKYDRLSVFRSVCVCIVLSLLYAGCTSLGLTSSVDCAVEDRFYQESGVPDERIVVVGITADDMQLFPTWPWDRDPLVQAVRQLNDDPKQKPAAIGIDMVLSSETNGEWDAELAQVCCETGNVVVACRALYDTRAFAAGANRAGSQTAENVLRPYKQLAAATFQGHNNIICDGDGIVRRHLWRVQEERGNEVCSLAEQIYRLYCGYHKVDESFTPSLINNFWYLEYTAHPGAYLTYTLSDIYDGNFDPADLAGRIVLIGSYLAEDGESCATSIDKVQRMYNVEYQANVLDAMLNHRDMAAVSDTVQATVLVFLIAVLSYFLFHISVFPGLCLYTMASIISVLMAGVLKDAGYALHPLWLPMQMSVSMLLALIIHYVRAWEGQRRMLNLFRRYLDPTILEDLLNGNSTSDWSNENGRHADIAVLFVDIRGFTALSERIAPEGVVDILNKYLAMTSSCVQQNNGTVNKFVGDCTMAVWGAVRPCKDAVWQACKAAMDMVGQMDKLSDEVEQAYGCKLAYGVGVHYGDAIIGNIGSEMRMDYTAIGDVVNTASRIEAMAPAGKVYVSGRVRELLGDRVTVGQQVGRITLKGKSVPVDIYEIRELHAMVNILQNQFSQNVIPACVGLPDASGMKNREKFLNLSQKTNVVFSIKEIREDISELKKRKKRTDEKE